MKNNLKYIIIFIITIIGIFYISDIFAGFEIPGRTEIRTASMNIDSGNDPVTSINNLGFSIFGTIKLILEGLLVIYIVYIGAQMIWSMGSDEEELSKGKRQLRYSLVSLLFINMPGSLYLSFHKGNHETLGNQTNNTGFLGGQENMFFDWFNFGYTFGDKVVGFLEVLIFAIAVVMIIYEGLKLISSRGREEKVTEAKNKVVYSILALVFVGVIEAWKSFAFDFKVSKVTNIFSEIADLALFFAGPIAFFFLTLAAYYYITSAGDEEKVKKAKSIVINTILATLILLAAYTFLLDLGSLSGLQSNQLNN